MSLLEAVAALAIVGMISVSALESIGAGFMTAARARRALEAEALVTQQIDRLDLLTDQELQSLPDSVAHGQFDAPLDEYTWTTESSPYSDQAGVYTIDLTVLWRTGSYKVRTYMYRRPLTVSR